MTYNVTEVDRVFIPMFARLAYELSDEGEEQSKLYKRVMDICHWLKSAHREIVTVRDALTAAEARIKELEEKIPRMVDNARLRIAEKIFKEANEPMATGRYEDGYKDGLRSAGHIANRFVGKPVQETSNGKE